MGALFPRAAGRRAFARNKIWFWPGPSGNRGWKSGEEARAVCAPRTRPASRCWRAESAGRNSVSLPSCPRYASRPRTAGCRDEQTHRIAGHPRRYREYGRCRRWRTGDIAGARRRYRGHFTIGEKSYAKHCCPRWGVRAAAIRRSVSTHLQSLSVYVTGLASENALACRAKCSDGFYDLVRTVSGNSKGNPILTSWHPDR